METVRPEDIAGPSGLNMGPGQSGLTIAPGPSGLKMAPGPSRTSRPERRASKGVQQLLLGDPEEEEEEANQTCEYHQGFKGLYSMHGLKIVSPFYNLQFHHVVYHHAWKET